MCSELEGAGDMMKFEDGARNYCLYDMSRPTALLSLTPHPTVSLSFRLLVGSISPSPVAGPGGALEMGLDHLDITEDTAELPVSDLSP